jgi:hypothetical protein
MPTSIGLRVRRSQYPFNNSLITSYSMIYASLPPPPTHISVSLAMQLIEIRESIASKLRVNCNKTCVSRPRSSPSYIVVGFNWLACVQTVLCCNKSNKLSVKSGGCHSLSPPSIATQIWIVNDSDWSRMNIMDSEWPDLIIY